MTAVYTFIAEEQADPECVWSVTEMCATLEVSRSGFYDWQSRGPSQRELDDRVLAREYRQRRIGIEGYEGSRWILMDYGDVVVHLFDDNVLIAFR